MLQKIKTWVLNNKSKLIYSCISISAIASGYLLKTYYPQIKNETLMKYMSLPGTILTRLFSLIVVPMIVISLASSIASAKSGDNKRILKWTLILFCVYSSLAPLLGSVLMFIARPGVLTPEELEAWNKESVYRYNPYVVAEREVSKEDTLYDFIINMFPDNIVGAMIMQQYTGLVPIDSTNATMGTKKVTEHIFNTNFIGMCLFGFILGFAMLLLDDKVPGTKQALKEIDLLIMQIIHILMKIFPILIIYFMVLSGIKLRYPKRLITQLLHFYAISIVGFVILLFVIHAGVYLVAVRKNPIIFYKKISPAILLAFATASSAITLPVTIESMENNVKLPTNVTRFVLPMGMNLHMNGFALYYPMVILFVAQMHGMDITAQQMAILIIMTLIMTVAIPAISSGKAVIITFVAFCTSVGIENPLDVLAYITATDWIMSRLRTATNVIGDCFVAAIVAKYCGDNTEQLASVV